MNSENLEILLYKAVQIGIALTLCVPLVILAYFGVTPSDESAKVIVFQSLIEITFVFYVGLCLVRTQYLPKKSMLLAAVTLFVAVEISAGIFGINPHRSFFGNIWRADAVVLHLHFLAFFVIITSVFKKREEWIRLLKVSVIVSAISSLVGVVQKLGINRVYGTEAATRIAGTLVSPGIFANFIALSIFLAILVVLLEKKKPMKFFWYAIIVLNSWALIFSKVRGAWLAALAGLFVLLVFQGVNLFKNKKFLADRKKIMVAAVVVLLIVFIGIFSVIFGKDNTVIDFKFDRSRLAYWGNALEAFKDRPVLGWGNDSFAYIWQKYSTRPDYAYEFIVDKPHNKFLEILVSSGVLGLLAFSLIFIYLFYKIFSYQEENHFNELPPHHLKAIFASFFVCYLVGNFFLFDSISSYIFLFMMLGFANNYFSKKFVPETDGNYSAKLSWLKLAVIVMVVFSMAFVMYHLNIKVALAGMYLFSARNSTLPQEALFGYQKVFAMDTVQSTDMRLIAFETMQDIIGIDSQADANIKKSAFSLLLKEKPEAYAAMQEPEQNKNGYYTALAKTYRSLFLDSNNQKYLEDADYILSESIKFNINNPVSYELLAEVRILQDKHEEGEKFAKSFYDSLPENPTRERRMYYVLAKAYYENNDLNKSFENVKKLLELDYVAKKTHSIEEEVYFNASGLIDVVARLYYNKSGNLKEVEEVYLKAMEIYPSYRSGMQRHLDEIRLIK